MKRQTGIGIASMAIAALLTTATARAEAPAAVWVTGYGVAKSSSLNYGDGGWAGWSVPAGKVALGGGFQLTGGPAAVSVPGTPGSVWPHYTFGAGEYGWVARDNPDGAASPGSYVHAIYADMLPGYEIIVSPVLNYSSGGWGGWSAPAGKVVLCGGFEANGPVRVSAPGLPNTAYPHYTYGPDEYGWVVQSAGATQIKIYVICANRPSGYEIVASPTLSFSDTGWGGWSVPSGKLVLGGGFSSASPVRASVPGLPNAVFPHYTFGPAEYGWVLQSSGGGATTVYAICADIRVPGPLPKPGFGSCLINPDAPQGPLFMLRISNASDGGPGYIGYDIYAPPYPLFDWGYFEPGESKTRFVVPEPLDGRTQWTLRKKVRELPVDPWQQVGGTHTLALNTPYRLAQLSLSAANNFMSVTDDGTGGDPLLCVAADRNATAHVPMDTVLSNGVAGVGQAVLWRVVNAAGAVYAAGDFLNRPAIASLSSVGGKQLFAQSGIDMNGNGVFEDDEKRYQITLNIIGVDIRAQGLDSGVVITANDPLTVTFDLIPGEATGVQGDWWGLAHEEGTDTWYSYVGGYTGASWVPWDFVSAGYQGPLVNLVAHKAVNAIKLPAGIHGKIYFGVDLIRNGRFDLDWFVYDEVDLTVTP